MKKLALVLGSLLVIGSAASAKEVMPAPMPEPEVKIVEKPVEVIVYRDRVVQAPAKWKPNGSIDVQYRWYGKTENKVDGQLEKEGLGEDELDWAREENNYGRLQTEAKINFTENQKLEVRTRNFHTWVHGKNPEYPKAKADKDSVRLRHFYNFGKIADTKVNATSRLEWDQKSGDGAKKLEASVGFNFADYLFNNEFVKTTNFTVRPLYAHKWTNHRGNDRKGSEVLGLYLESNFEFPYGFELEFKLEPTYTFYGTKQMISDKDGENLREKKRALDMDVTLILSNSVNLYTQDKFALDFKFEGGYDPYSFHQYRSYDKKTEDVGAKRSYSLYALPTLEASYQATEFVKLYAAAGAEYRNWKVKDEDYATRWRWQPTAWAGMKVNF
ncbi:hypothetical protein EGX98_03250 [Fusobacterium necrophorum]|nr:hypothetical protein [Fusobacterium necrophorum]AYZ73148.1 hypothetical protein EGX98_03250 [Fusobacterium necrophorum]AZW08854.1 hypothetical protein EO219_04160 [Fusobacterium necrophorum subsp. necrophorum]KDE71699.1 membrane protein [Fusobacterium necrophorum BFTR-2]SDB46884.1 hypothetical protein SAMN02983009_02260 [Fusobacterium necrophorum]SQD09816.1 Uncharacterised protein [Fusobacterium necrophorum subsp. necrophorum]